MVRTFAFLEGLVAVALALLMPLLARDFALAVAAPLAFVILIPLAASLSARPLPFLREALAAAFTGKTPEADPLEAIKALNELGGYVRRAAVLGVIVSLSAAAPRIGSGEALLPSLFFGLWLALYGVLAALAARILALAVGRLIESAQAGEPAVGNPAARAAAFRARFGVSSREWEVAQAIVSGASYKEAADLLFISLSTVKAHLSSVYRKTGTRDKVELLLLLRREDCWK